jgi:prevent-host-death family protein
MRSAVLDWLSPTWPDLAMKRVKIAELKDHLSEHLRSVERGGQLLVTDRDRPIARIVPVAGSGSAARIRAPKRSFAAIRAKRYAPARWKIRSLALLLEERRDR